MGSIRDSHVRGIQTDHKLLLVYVDCESRLIRTELGPRFNRGSRKNIKIYKPTPITQWQQTSRRTYVERWNILISNLGRGSSREPVSNSRMHLLLSANVLLVTSCIQFRKINLIKFSVVFAQCNVYWSEIPLYGFSNRLVRTNHLKSANLVIWMPCKQTDSESCRW